MGEPKELALEPAQDPAPVEGGHEVEGEADGGNQELVEHLGPVLYNFLSP